MFRVIETYDYEHTVTIQGHTYPALALLEDQDGIRALLHAGDIPIRVWAHQASPAGAAYLIDVAPSGTVRACTASDFLEDRQETADSLRPAPLSQRDFIGLPTYRDVVSAAKASREARQQPLKGFVHLHTHSEYSTLDGLSTAAEMVDTIVGHGQEGLGFADHGTCAGHPDLAKFSAAAGIRPVYGIEAYFVNDRIARPEKGDVDQRKLLADYYHLVLWAKDDKGLDNLWAMSTESNRDGFYGKPRMDWDTLARHSEGIMASTACLRGPLTHHALLEGRPDIARQNLGRLLDIYGDDLFVEIHTNQLPEQIEVNKALVVMAREHGVGLVAAADSHYPTKGHKLAHRTWLAIQTNDDISDDSSLFAGNQDYHLSSEAEVRESLAYLGDAVVDEAIGNTTLIARKASAKISGETVTPIFVKKGGRERDIELMREICEKNWHLTEGKTHPESVYRARLEGEEFPLIISKGFPGYFLIVADYCNHARSVNILVGPGRGSGGGSLTAYLMGITSIDPVEADLLFARFMTPGRTELPDFDVDFPQSKKQYMADYIRTKYGEEYVTVVGSITRLKSKGIVADLGRAMKSTLSDTAFVDLNKFSAFVKMAEADTAGLGMPWEDLWAQHEDSLAVYRQKYPDLFAMADLLVGRVKTYGQHAAGMVISTDQPLTGRLPMRRGGDDGHMVAQFEKNALEQLGFTKFDLLTLRNLDTIQDCLDLIKARRGISIDLLAWRDELTDPQVWEEIAAGHTLGIFQIETQSSTPLIKEMKPQNLAELADAITLVRPGPKNSGLTRSYLLRRRGEEEISYPDERMEQVLKPTYGCMIYQEQVMAACMLLAGYDTTEADTVRSILGKKKVEKVKPAGEEFIRRAVEQGMTKYNAEHLWWQMAEFAKYSFNKAHAFGYAMLGYWCAFLKVHYPIEFLTAALSTVDKDRIPEFVKEARRLGIQVLPPDVNESRTGFRAVDSLTIRYGLDSVKGIGDSGARGVMDGQPYYDFQDYLARKGSGADTGVTRLLAKVGAFDGLYPNRRALETRLLEERGGIDSLCVFKTLDLINEQGLPCVYDWENEPLPVNPKTGKKLKAKPVPKKCTKACRQYEAPPAKEHADLIEPYTAEDIRQIEQEMLGCYLSSTPFDRLDPEDRAMLFDQAELLDVGPEGSYMLAAIITRVKPHKTGAGDPMGFLDLSTEACDLSCVVFTKDWDRYQQKKGLFKVGSLCYIEVIKNPRGYNLRSFLPAL